MLIIETIAYLIGSLLILLTVLPLFKFDVWWIRIGDFPRLQIAFLCGLVSAAFLIFVYPPTSFKIIRFPLDHVFHTNHFRVADIKRLSSIGSDHFPIYVALEAVQKADT